MAKALGKEVAYKKEKLAETEGKGRQEEQRKALIYMQDKRERNS